MNTTYDVTFSGGQASGHPFENLPADMLMVALADALPMLGPDETVTISVHKERLDGKYGFQP